MSDRQLIVVDLETTGLDATRHVPLEVAAVNRDSGETIHFVPHLYPADLALADYEALRVNRYFERGVYRDMLSPEATAAEYQRLFDMLKGQAFAGANPRFDAEMLIHAPGALTYETWHYRLPDVSSYVAGALGLYPSELEGLDKCCERLGVVNNEPHSALADAQATAECLFRAMEHARAGALA